MFAVELVLSHDIVRSSTRDLNADVVDQHVLAFHLQARTSPAEIFAQLSESRAPCAVSRQRLTL